MRSCQFLAPAQLLTIFLENNLSSSEARGTITNMSLDANYDALFQHVSEMRALCASRPGVDSDQLATTFEKVVLQVILFRVLFLLLPSCWHRRGGPVKEEDLLH